MTPSSLSLTWALYPNPGRAVDAALADRAGVGVVQADQPGRAGRELPGEPGPGLGHDLRGALDGDRQLAQCPHQPAARPPAQRPGHRAAAVARHRGGLGRGLLSQTGELAGQPGDRLRALLTR
jgi:hypothetical protein